MGYLTWYVTTASTDITSKVLSMNITYGRQKYLDPYSGGSAVITINNAGDYAAGLTYGQPLTIYTQNGGNYGYFAKYWIQSVDFDEYPGNTGLNTATITAVDAVSRSGRILATSLSLAATTTNAQATAFNSTSGGPLPSDMTVISSSTGSQASAITYTGQVLNYLNYLQTTERGIFFLNNNLLYFVTRNQISGWVAGTYQLGRTSSATAVAYQEVRRIQNGTQYINTATVQSAGVADQTAVNSASVASYGAAFYSSATVDANATQALGNANWVVNTFSDPSAIRFEVTVNDWGQNTTAFDAWFRQLFQAYPNPTVGFMLTKLTYLPPGGADTTVTTIVEGFTANVTPTGTTFTMNLSPLTYYQFFTLDSTALGILDTSRLGW